MCFPMSGRGDLNSRPLGPEPSALPGYATPRLQLLYLNIAKRCRKINLEAKRFFEQFEILFESFPRSHSSSSARLPKSTGFAYRLETMSTAA